MTVCVPPSRLQPLAAEYFRKTSSKQLIRYGKALAIVRLYHNGGRGRTAIGLRGEDNVASVSEIEDGKVEALEGVVVGIELLTRNVVELGCVDEIATEASATGTVEGVEDDGVLG
jgi:hypothetical protein